MRGRHRGITILLALAVATAAAVVAYAAVTNADSDAGNQPALSAARQPETSPVVFAGRDIPSGATLTAEMLEVRQVPPEAKSPRALGDLDLAVGRLTAVPLTAGEQVLDTRLTDQPTEPQTFAREVPVGKRAFSLVFDEVQGTGGLVQPGDHVDVVAYFEFDVKEVEPVEPATDGDEDDTEDQEVTVRVDIQTDTADDEVDYTQYVTVYVAQNVEVLAVAQALTPDEVGIADRSPDDSTSEDEGEAASQAEPKVRPDAKSVTLAVTPEQAQRLLLAAQTVTDKRQERDAALRLAVRAPGDTTIYDLPPAQLGEIPIGGLLGDVHIPLTPTELVITDVQFTSRVVSSGQVLEFTATVKNVSDRTISSGADAPPEYVYTQGVGYDDLGFFAQPDTYRIGLNVAGASPIAFPYRWGLGRDLAPGESITIVGAVQLTEPTPDTRYWLGVILEPNTVTQDGAGVTNVTVLTSEVVTATTSAPLLAAPEIGAEVVLTVAAGERLTVLGVRGPWFRVRRGEIEGWIAAPAITTPPTADQLEGLTGGRIGEETGPLGGWVDPGL